MNLSREYLFRKKKRRRKACVFQVTTGRFVTSAVTSKKKRKRKYIEKPFEINRTIYSYTYQYIISRTYVLAHILDYIIGIVVYIYNIYRASTFNQNLNRISLALPAIRLLIQGESSHPVYTRVNRGACNVTYREK